MVLKGKTRNEVCSFSVLGIEILMSFITGNGIVLNATGNGKFLFKIETGMSRYFVNGHGIS